MSQYTKPGVFLRDLDEVMLQAEKRNYEACISAGLEFLGKEDEFVHLPAEQRIMLAMQYANGLSTQVHNLALQKALYSITAQEQTVSASDYYEQEARSQRQRDILSDMLKMPSQTVSTAQIMKLANIPIDEDLDSGEDVQREDDRSESPF